MEKKKGSPSPQLITNISKEAGQTTIWNAKVDFFVDYRVHSMIVCRHTDVTVTCRYILGTNYNLILSPDFMRRLSF